MSAADYDEFERLSRGAGNAPREIVQPPKKKSKKGLIIALVIVLALVGGVAFGGYSVYQQASAEKAKAYETISQAKNIKASLSAFDFETAYEQAVSLQKSVREIKQDLDAPLWSFVGALPIVSEDVTYVRTLIDTMDDLSTNALIPLMEQLRGMTPESLKVDGKINLGAIASLASSLVTFAPEIDKATLALQSLPNTHFDEISSKVDPLVKQLVEVGELIRPFLPIAKIIPDVAGANGPRTYLIAAQNSAETRSTGGFPGAIGTLTIADGSFELGSFASCHDVMGADLVDYTYVTEEEATIFGNWMAWAPNVGYHPDFTRVAQIWVDGYYHENGVYVDGVISVVPSVVQDILAITGGITLSDGTVLDGTNTTRVLQNEMYLKYLSGDVGKEENEASDALFGEAAKLAFAQLTSHMGMEDLKAYFELAKSTIADRRVMFWLSDEDEQALISQFDCSGALNWNIYEPKLGTYFNCTSGSKQGWYDDMETTIGPGSKNVDGTTSYQVTTVFRNNITAYEGETGGEYIMGVNEEKGDMYPFIYFVAPMNGSISNFTTDTGTPFEVAQLYDHQIVYFNGPKIPTEGSMTCTYTVTTSNEAQKELGIIATPMLTKYRQ